MKNDLLIPAIAWIVLSVICIALISSALRVVLKRTGWNRPRQQKIFLITTATIIAWVVVLLLLSYNGSFTNFNTFPPGPALVVLIPLPIVFLIAFSKTGTELLTTVPSQWLVFIQTFRIAVELLLLLAFVKGKIPVQMTFEGRNFDILTGILALPVGYLIAHKKSYASQLAIAFNIIGLLLLINILVIAVLSMPTPIRYFENEPANTLVAEFPFILLPGLLVPIAYTMHIFSLRALLSGNRSSSYKFPVAVHQVVK